MLTISDSIALKILDESCLIAGVGNEIRVFTDGGNRTLPFQLKGKIHGIEWETYSNWILIFGEYEFILVERANSSFQLLYRGTLSDWVSSGKILKDGHGFVLVTAHSVALYLIYHEDTKSCEIRVRSSCTDKSTLYCSFVCGSTWEDSVIIGGNAFGEVLIWQPSKENSTDVPRTELLYRIAGHNGVVFSIDVDLETRLMVTTSDDRSIRFWDISLHRTSDNRLDFAKSIFTPRKSGYGHIARVFKGKIVHEGNETYAITGGEDSFICLWNLNCELVFKRRQQFGATIWNLDYHSPTKTIFTAGSSGNITQYSLEDHFPRQKKVISVVSSESLGPSEYIAKVKFLNAGNLIGITNKNRLMHRKCLFSGEWIVIEDFPSYKSTVLEIYNEFIAIAGYQKVTIYKFDAETESINQIYHDTVLPGVIRSIIFLSGNDLLISDELGNCKLSCLLRLNDSQSADLPLCKERWLTSACKVNNEFLVASNRQGSLLLFPILNDLSALKTCDTIKRLHGHLGATTISLVKDTSSYSILKTTGHDSTIRTIKLNKTHQSLTVICRELVPIVWVERRAPCTENNCELLFGFNDNHFVLWSRENDVHFEISCGGGHRCWDLQLDLKSNQVAMVFIQKKQVLLHREMVFNKSSMPLSIPRNKWHVKPCNIMSAIHNEKKIYLVSGGDDNLLKISRFHTDHQSLEELFEIHSHISNIRALRTWKTTPEKYLVFSAGGRAQICVTLFDETSSMVEELVDYSIQREKPSNDIRFDPETRIMSIDIHQTAAGLIEIFVGCSDGYLRKFIMNEAFRLNLDREEFYGRCILQVRVVGDYVLTTSTDGTICFWKLDLSVIALKVAHHESGVNSFDARYDDEGVFHLLTGGDDQQVVYSSVIHSSEELTIKNIRKLDHLHSAQVTAVCFSPSLRAFYTSSIDQMVRRVELNTFESNWQRFSCVADIKGINIVQHYALLFGCGIQAFDLDEDADICRKLDRQ